MDAPSYAVASPQFLGLGLPQALILAGLVAGALALVFFTRRVRRGLEPELRPVAGYRALSRLAGWAVERGRPLHVSLGTGGLGGTSTPESLAALAVLAHLAEHVASSDLMPTVTVADGALLALAEDTLGRGVARRALPRTPQPAADYERGKAADDIQRKETNRKGIPPQVRFLAATPLAYAAAAADVIAREEPAANVAVGAFGDEYLWLGEAGARRDVAQVAGAADVSTLPFVITTSPWPVIGEELFASGAYLSRRPAHLGSLQAQDWARWLIAVAVVAAVLARTLGLL